MRIFPFSPMKPGSAAPAPARQPATPLDTPTVIGYTEVMPATQSPVSTVAHRQGQWQVVREYGGGRFAVIGYFNTRSAADRYCAESNAL